MVPDEDLTAESTQRDVRTASPYPRNRGRLNDPRDENVGLTLEIETPLDVLEFDRVTN